MEFLGLLGYIFASAAYFVFILLLLAARNKTVSGILVLLGSIATLISFAVGAWQLQQLFTLKAVFICETFKLLFWLLLIVTTRENTNTLTLFLHHKKVQQCLLVWLLAAIGCWSAAFYIEQGGKYLFMLLLTLNLGVLVLLEQLYRNAELKAKWALWPLVIALGSCSVFDFIVYAQAALVNQLDFTLWYIRSLVAIVAVPFLLISTRRMKDWSVNVFISREVVFYSSMLMISGLYLLVMAFAGYVINIVGGEWGSVISWAFLLLGGAVLAALLITERLRRQVKVFITKHFFANKYDYRVEWTKLIEQLEISDSGDYYKTALNTIRTALKIEHGLLVKKLPFSSYQTLSGDGMELTPALSKELALIEEFCGNTGWIFDLKEYQKVENSYPELFIDTVLFNRLAIDIVVPILFNKVLYGFFLLSKPAETHQMLNWEDRDLLSSITKQLSHYLSLNEANDELSQAKQFDAFNRMSAFLVHDLKNVQAQLALINTNAQKHRDNPDFIADVFETIESATNRLEKVLTQLHNKKVAEVERKTVTISQLLEKVVNQRNVSLPSVVLEVEQDGEMRLDHETFSSIINHLIQNAQEATNENGWVNIKASHGNDQLHIRITDNGCGMSEDFIKNRLFKPFDTTKGNAGMGIGVFEAKQFIENLGGSIHVSSIEHRGTEFHLAIPRNNNLMMEK